MYDVPGNCCSTISASCEGRWVGKSSVTRRQPAMLWKRLWILAHLPDLITNVLACRRSAPAAEQPRINRMSLWLVRNLIWPILRGP